LSRVTGLAAVSALVALLSSMAAGQTDSLHAGLSIETPGRRMMVIVDSCLTGYTPLSLDSISAGRHTLRLLSLPLTRWTSARVVDTVTLSPGERRHLSYTPPPEHRISSLPSGAMVSVNGTPLGPTPMTLTLAPRPTGDTVLLEKSGYQRSELLDWGLSANDTLVSLLESWPPLNRSTTSPPLLPNEDRPVLRILLPAAGSIVAGTVSAYCKIHADDLNSQYLLTGNPGLHKEVQRYDLYSALALVVMEAGIGLLVYYLMAP
jgi:hypothetical protein